MAMGRRKTFQQIAVCRERQDGSFDAVQYMSAKRLSMTEPATAAPAPTTVRLRGGRKALRRIRKAVRDRR